MKFQKAVVLVLGLLLAGTFAAAQQVNVTGDWELTMTTPRGEMKTVYTFTQDGEKLAVKTTGRNGQEITGTGTVKGNEIEWSITRSTPRGEFTSTYKGKVEGDKMSGTVEFMQNPVEWTAVRKK